MDGIGHGVTCRLTGSTSYLQHRIADSDLLMRSTTESLHRSHGSPYRRGLVSGHILKLIRESLGQTQFDLAQMIGVEVATVQGWETGRRPITALRVSDLAFLRARLIQRGANPRLFEVLRDAFEADFVLESAVRHGPSSEVERLGHPLAATVHRRDLTNLITWAVAGSFPSQLVGLVKPSSSRRGPASARPELSVNERSRFFGHLLRIADECRGEADTLMRRQAIYLLAFDADVTTAEWLVDEHRQALRRAHAMNDVPSWVAVRSASVALARYGQQEPLIDFVATGLRDDLHAVANLNYWSYWVGEGAETFTDDTFMTSGDPQQVGRRLFGHLVERLGCDAEQVELYIHTLWQLLLVSPKHAVIDPSARIMAQRKIEELNAAHLTGPARQKLSDVAYGLRLFKQ